MSLNSSFIFRIERKLRWGTKWELNYQHEVTHPPHNNSRHACHRTRLRKFWNKWGGFYLDPLPFFFLNYTSALDTVLDFWLELFFLLPLHLHLLHIYLQKMHIWTLCFFPLILFHIEMSSGVKIVRTSCSYQEIQHLSFYKTALTWTQSTKKSVVFYVGENWAFK